MLIAPRKNETRQCLKRNIKHLFRCMFLPMSSPMRQLKFRFVSIAYPKETDAQHDIVTMRMREEERQGVL